MDPKICAGTIEKDEEFKKVEGKMKYLCRSILEIFSEELEQYKAMLKEKSSHLTTMVPSATSLGRRAIVPAVTGSATSSVIGMGTVIRTITEAVINYRHRKYAKTLNISAYDKKKEEWQKILIKAGIEIFIAYEYQLDNCYVDKPGETLRALRKIAYDIVMKILNGMATTNDLSVETIKTSILESKWNFKTWIMYLWKNKRTENRTIKLVTTNSETSTNDLFVKPGLRIKEDDGYRFYTNKYSEPSKYGYRNCFDVEIIDFTDLTLIRDADPNYIYKLTSVNIGELTDTYFHEFAYSNFNNVTNPSNTNETVNIPYIFKIKKPVYNFVGREDYLARIDKCFFVKNKKKVVVYGMAAMGKTELLKKYISHNLDSRYQHIIWINSDTKEAIKSSFSEVAKHFGIPEQVCAGDISNMLHAVFTKLKEKNILAKKETLLIYDNVDENIYLSDYLPIDEKLEASRINILVTSRISKWGPHYKVLHLNTISNEESLKLIKNTIADKKKLINILDEDENWAHKIIEINGGLPLALQQAIAYIIEEGRTSAGNPFEIYLSNYTAVLDTSYDNQRPLPHTFESEYRNTLYVTYKMALDKLKANNNNITIMQICSFLDPNGVNKSILYKFLNKADVNSSIRSLEDYSLMQITDDTVVVHRLILAITRDLYLKENSSTILKFNLGFNYLIQLNSVTLVTSEQFFTFLRSVYSTFIFQYVDENINEVKGFYETLTNAEKGRFYLLLVYHGCSATVISISDKEEDYYPKSFRQTFDITEICDKMKDISESFAKEDDQLLRWLNKKKYAGSALNIACIEGREEISKYLIRQIKEYDQNLRYYMNRFNMPLIHCVLHREHDQIFKYLMKNGANIEEKDENGSTLLHVASSVGRYDIIQLLKGKLPLDGKNIFGDTLLHSCFYNQIYPKEQLKYLFTPVSRDNLANDEFAKHDVCSYFKAITKDSPISIFTEHNGFAHENKDCISIYYKSLNKKNHASYTEIINEYSSCGELNICNKYGIYPSHLHALTNNIIIKNDVWPTTEMSVRDNVGNDVLHYACGNACWEVVKSNMENNTYVSKKNNFGFQILHSVACTGDRDMLEFVLKRYTDINTTDNNGCSVLHVALINKQYDLATWIIPKISDVNQTFQGISALHLTAAAGKLDIIEKLLEKNAKINQQDDFGWSALHFIFTANCYKSENKTFMNNPTEKFSTSKINNLDFYNKKELNIENIRGTETTIQSETFNVTFAWAQFDNDCKQNILNILIDATITNPFMSLYVLSAEEQYKVTKLLISRNIDVNLVNSYKASCLHFACYFGHTQKVLDKGVHIDQKPIYGLQEAMHEGHFAIVELLLETRADIHAGAIDGTTALHWASIKGHTDIVKKLLEKGADIMKQDNKLRLSALHIASYKGSLATVELLLEKGADIHACAINGRTALHLASSEGHTDIVKKLLEKEADIMKQDKKRWTALHFAARDGHLTTVELLLETGADIHACAIGGRTALHWASIKGHTDIVKKLLEKGADIIEQEKSGWMALHFAAYHGHLTTVELLLETGADIHACAIGGATALHLASIKGHTDIVNKLLEKMSNIMKQEKDERMTLHFAARAQDTSEAKRVSERGHSHLRKRLRERLYLTNKNNWKIY